jgi:hypothetical protein
LHRAFNQGEQCVVFTLTNAYTWVEFISYLSHKNVPCSNMLTTETLDTAPLRIGIATVAARALTFFMCHLCIPFYRMSATKIDLLTTHPAQVTAKEVLGYRLTTIK